MNQQPKPRTEDDAFEAWWAVVSRDYTDRSRHHQIELRAVARAAWDERAKWWSA